MIEFNFVHATLGLWTVTITLTNGMTGGEAFDQAAADYRSSFFPDYVPGHPDVTIRMRGV